MSTHLQRRTTEEGRVYTDMEDIFLPSVTTILDQKPESQGLKYWKQKYDGSGNKKHWRDILSYKANRGTLAHYELLNEFAEDDMYSTNEQNSENELKNNNKYNRYKEEVEYVENAWNEIKSTRGIRDETVLDVECFVTNSGIGYAGQFDLLYIDTNGDLVLSDLKTSKRVYDKHKMQLVAYDNAISLDIDTLEVIKIHPDSESYAISHSHDWVQNRNEIFGEFAQLRGQMSNVEQEFKQIANDGIDDE
ncbi:hypothetical protein GLT90_02130 [Nanohaloarchaea archaeon H12]|nr:hypothetical protein [Nanohaloarchaea archaeon H12]